MDTDVSYPRCIDAEAAVLGCMLIERAAVVRAIEILEPSDFHMESHRAIFEAMTALSTAGSSVDTLTVVDELRRATVLEQCGGMLYLVNLMDAPSTAANIEHYCAIVRRFAVRRLIMSRAAELFRYASTDELETITQLNGHFNGGELAARAHIRPDDFESDIWTANDAQIAEPVAIWFGVYRGSITLLNGARGAGKSSLLYNIAGHAAANAPLFGFGWADNPLRVLFVDPENTPGLRAMKLSRIFGDSYTQPNLQFHNASKLDLTNAGHMARLAKYISEHNIDLLILDPLINLFVTADENDNAEAARQMKPLTDLKNTTNVAIILCHHTGKNEANGSRGASSREGSADVVMTFRPKLEKNEDEIDDDYRDDSEERGDMVRLRITKNRWASNYSSLYLRMAGNDKFQRISWDEWRGTAPDEPITAPDRALDIAKNAVLKTLDGDVIMSMRDIVDTLKLENSIGINSTRTAVNDLHREGKLESKKFGQSRKYWLRTAPNLSDDGYEIGERNHHNAETSADIEQFFGQNSDEKDPFNGQYGD